MAVCCEEPGLSGGRMADHWASNLPVAAEPQPEARGDFAPPCS